MFFDFLCFLASSSSFQRRTRAVFDVAIKVHQNIQERDIEAGRNLGNWILRWLDRMKPSAHIRGHPPATSSGGSSSVNTTKQATNSSSQLKTPGNVHTSRDGESSRHLFTSSRSTWSKPFPSIAMIMRPKPAAGTMTQYRHFCINGPDALLWNYSFVGLNGRLKAFA